MGRDSVAVPTSQSADPAQDGPREGRAMTPSLGRSGMSLRLTRAARPQPNPTPDRPAAAPHPPRCRVKGCIFPAANLRAGRCLVHDRAEKEPKHFLSVQPSVLLLDRAKFGIPDPDYDDLRARDRRRLAALQERFREEVA